ncbi:MAG: glycosyltransferase family 4 protein [Bacteriovoracia bacterium]
MKLAYNARHAHYGEPAQIQYARALISGVTKINSAASQDETIVFGNTKILSSLPLFTSSNAHLRFFPTKLPIHRQSVGLAWEQALLNSHLKKVDPDIVHHLFFFMPPVTKQRSYKNVVTFHDLAFVRTPEHFNLRTRLYFELFAKPATKNADAVVAISDSVRSDLIELYGVSESKIHRIYEACNPIFETLAKTSQSSSTIESQLEGSPFLLIVGVLHKRKNLVHLINALDAANSSLKEMKIVFIGRKSYGASEVFNAVNNSSIKDRTLFFENLPIEELVWAYQNTSLFIAPSFSEGFCFPALEAMNCHAPILAANRGSLPEILQDYAMYFDVERKESLVEALRSFEIPQKRWLESKADLLLQRFSWEKTCKQTYALYQSIR